MEAEARYTYVGAAVLVLLAALVAGIVWLKDIAGREQFEHYVIYFERQPLDGLEIGAPVNLRGIKIGRVEDYALSEEKINRVRVVIRVDRRAPVRVNTVAVVTRNIVTGIASITLLTREPPGASLTEVPPGEKYPVIAEGQSSLEEIAGQVQQLGVQAQAALENLNQLLTADNRRAVMDTVRNLRDLSAGVNRRLAALDRTLASTGAAASSVAAAATRLARAGDRAAATIEDTGARLGRASDRANAVAEQVGARLDDVLARTQDTITQAKAALERVAASADAVQRQTGDAAQRLETSAATVDDQLSAAVTELQLSMEVATRALDRLRDPRAALLGPGRAQLGPGEAPAR
jgi:phospholipid/cholesterol/gamma-HCH transport system substrate-binding protein